MENKEYDRMDFATIDQIRNQIISGEKQLTFDKKKTMLHVKSMMPVYRYRLLVGQNVSFILLLISIVLLFINWWIAILSTLLGLASGLFVSKQEPKYIIENCKRDNAFLKFALVVGLVSLK